MSDKLGCVYIITNNINNKRYIGQTTRSFKERWLEHKRHDNIIIDKAIKKYGVSSFTYRYYKLPKTTLDTV